MRRLFALLPVLLVAFVVFTGTTAVTTENACAAENTGRTPLPLPAKSGFGEKCVAPTDVMRREHMNFLYNQRDQILREGRRGMDYSLRGCVECHAVPDPDAANPAMAEFRTVQPFCSACHNYASVSIDCFTCHTDKTRNMQPVLNNLIPIAKTTSQMIEDMQTFLRAGPPSAAHPLPPESGGGQ